MDAKRVAVLYSGGLDSTAMLFQAVKQFGAENVVAIYTYFGQRNVNDEKESFEYFTKKLGVTQTKELNLKQIFEDVSMEEVTGDKSTPNGTRKMYNRNMVLIACATAKAMQMDCTVLWHGAHYSDAAGGFVDCTEAFYTAARNCVSVAYPWFTIEMPLIEKTKDEVIRWGMEAGMTRLDIPHTWSCYRASTGEKYTVDGIEFKKPCRECETCHDRYDNGLAKIFPDIY